MIVGPLGGWRCPGWRVLGLALLAAGCGGVDAGPAVYPVSGLVLVDGKPAAKAFGLVPPTGRSDASAAFRLEEEPDVVRDAYGRNLFGFVGQLAAALPIFCGHLYAIDFHRPPHRG